MFEFSNRDHGELLIEEIDVHAQLAAVRSLLRRQRGADEALSEEIDKIREAAMNASGEYAMHLENTWVDNMHAGVFQDAAHTMSALGMLAPTTESLLVAVFVAIEREKLFRVADFNGLRAKLKPPELWDPHFVARYSKKKKRYSKEKDIADGARQLAQATGLAAFMPAGWETRLKALFFYRNKMFHNGLEWPMDERKRFEKAVESWPSGWFAKSERGAGKDAPMKPWIFYMTEAFIEDTLAMIEGIIEAVGAYSVDQVAKRGVEGTTAPMA